MAAWDSEFRRRAESWCHISRARRCVDIRLGECNWRGSRGSSRVVPSLPDVARVPCAITKGFSEEVDTAYGDIKKNVLAGRHPLGTENSLSAYLASTS